MFDSPTAYTLERASFNVQTLAYDKGGMELKSFVGLHDSLYFGLSFDVQHLIGSEKPKPGIPGAVFKVKVIDKFKWVPAIALGYDSFYIGSNGVNDAPKTSRQRIMRSDYMIFFSPEYYFYRKHRDKNQEEKRSYNRMQYGPYAVFTIPLPLFDSEQLISVGARMPVQPYFEPKNTSYFVSVDIPIGEIFKIKAEVERIFWNFRKPGEWQFNGAVRMTYFENLGIELGMLYEPGEEVNRILRIDYHGQF